MGGGAHGFQFGGARDGLIEFGLHGADRFAGFIRRLARLGLAFLMARLGGDQRIAFFRQRRQRPRRIGGMGGFALHIGVDLGDAAFEFALRPGDPFFLGVQTLAHAGQTLQYRCRLGLTVAQFG